MSDGYVLEAQSSGLEVSVLVNGATAFDSWDAAGRMISYPLSPWLVEGRNRVEVRLAKLPPDPSAEPFFRIAIHRASQSGRAWDGSAIAVYRYTERESALAEGVLRTVFAHEFSNRVSREKWSFLEARPFDGSARPAAVAVVHALHAALAQRDLRQVKALVSVKITETALGLGLPRAQVEAELDATLLALLSADDWHMDPLDTTRLELDVRLGGRLVALRAPGGRPALSGAGAGVGYSMSPVVAFVGSTWQVVR